MDHTTAVKRTPVEIWRMIFALALQTWLLPDKDSHILDNLLLFSGSCKLFAEYMRVEDIKKRLQLVCKFWNAILGDLGIKLAISSFKSIAPSSIPHLYHAQRVEYSFVCICRPKCSYTSRVSAFQLQGRQPVATVNALHVSIKLENARIVSLGHNLWAEKAAVDALRYAKRLLAYACRSHVFFRNQGPELQGIYTGLTHLSLAELCMGDMTIALRLPRLHYLQMSVRMVELHTKIGYVPISKWVLPKLTSFSISGIALEEPFAELHQFIRNHSSLIKNLILELYVYTAGALRLPSIDFHILRQLSHLELFGYRLSDIEDADFWLGGTYSEPLGLSLLLSDCDVLSRRDRNWITSAASQCIQLCSDPISLFDKIILVQTWEELSCFWEADEAHRRAPNIDKTACTLFEELHKHNIPVFDRDGIRLGEGDRGTLWERYKAPMATPSER